MSFWGHLIYTPTASQALPQKLQAPWVGLGLSLVLHSTLCHTITFTATCFSDFPQGGVLVEKWSLFFSLSLPLEPDMGRAEMKPLVRQFSVKVCLWIWGIWCWVSGALWSRRQSQSCRFLAESRIPAAPPDPSPCPSTHIQGSVPPALTSTCVHGGSGHSLTASQWPSSLWLPPPSSGLIHPFVEAGLP